MTQSPTIIWQPHRIAAPARTGGMAAGASPATGRTLARSVWRGLRGRCPCCGRGRAFAGFLRVTPSCDGCGAALAEIRADDLPPYVVIFGLGHVIIPLMLLATRLGASDWLQAAIFLPLALVLSLALIRPAKGATLGLMVVLGLGRTPGP